MDRANSADLIYGRWPVREALGNGTVAKILLAEGVHGKPVDEILELARQKKVPFHWAPRFQLDRLVGGPHQGVIAHVAAARLLELEALWEVALSPSTQGASVLFLDGITDPQNLGSILRTAAFFGVPAVVIPRWRSATLTGSVVKASAGAARLLSIAQVSNLAQALERAKEKGLWIVGADPDGRDIRSADIPRPFGLVLGAEGPGLHQLVKRRCDMIVSISRRREEPGIDSLNVGAACAVLLHQLGVR
ncbi:MAG: 23S rRNA (guanosine(2251)-2'-O)-methyltransferase RlmB [Elusimicrobia bacterium]|nr:23S rRNA (guanosine(2251)-2'-O)-methyltransferase RlmB [Candidatus Obscuribacterium magneticum]